MALWRAEGQWASRWYTFDSPSASGLGADAVSHAVLNWHFQVAGAISANADGPDSTLRCDSAAMTALTRSPEGCVFNLVTETMVFDARPARTPKVAEVADNVYQGQRNLPSRWGVPANGHPLTRTANEVIIDANRAVACGAVVITPNVTNCDEFPMATTYQGASRVAPNDYRVAVVPIAANSSQGATMQAFYYGAAHLRG